MEADSGHAYMRAAARAADSTARKLLGDLAMAEMGHLAQADAIERKRLPGERRDVEDEDARKRFVLRMIEPGLVGLMGGSVPTLAPVLPPVRDASAVQRFPGRHHRFDRRGYLDGFTEALADDGKLSGRGASLLRGVACGLMRAGEGGVGHNLQFLIADFWTATIFACFVILMERGVIAYMQYRYMDTPPLSATAKVILGGGFVLAAGDAIGNG